MSRELVPANKNLNLEFNQNSPKKSNYIWSFASNNLNTNIQLLQEEKYKLENQLKSKLKYRQISCKELEVELKRVNALRSECDQINNLCEIEEQKKIILEKNHQNLQNNLNQKEEHILFLEKETENLKENYLIEVEKITNILENKNSLLAEIIAFQIKNEKLDEKLEEEKLMTYEHRINSLEQEVSSLKKNLDEMKNFEETWKRIDSVQVKYLLDLFDDQNIN